MEFDVIQGDIVQQKADVLVSSAGTSLSMVAGVAGAIKRAGGARIEQEARSKGPLDLAATRVTGAPKLDAEYVIHAAATPHYGPGRSTAASIEVATHNALKRADRLGCHSLVIPALGCGAGGFDLSRGARIIGSTLRAYDAGRLNDVRFIAHSEESFETVLDAVD